MRMRKRRGPQILVGSKCIDQFKTQRAVELMNLLERGLSVEFKKRTNDNHMIYKICRLGPSRKEALIKMFPGLFHARARGFITVKDTERVLKRGDQIEQLIGQLYLKAVVAHNPVDFFIWRFERKRMKSKNSIIIDGDVWTMKRLRYPYISKYPYPCPLQECTARFRPGVTAIIPCERVGQKPKWICASHIGWIQVLMLLRAVL